MHRRDWTLAQAGELTLPQAHWLISQAVWHDPYVYLVDSIARMMPGSNGEGIIPPRPVKKAKANSGSEEKVLPEFARALVKRGWTPPPSCGR